MEAPEVVAKRKEAFQQLSKAHADEPKALLAKLGVDGERGLSADQVTKNRALYGRNEFPAEAGTPLWLLVLKQFQDTLVIILILAAVISFVLAFFEKEEEAITAFVEPLVIVLILIANATVGVLQESSAEAAVEALKAYESESAAVIRDGNVQKVEAPDLVVGDIVEVEVGNLIPADIRVLEVFSSTMDVEQGLLTGESANVEKRAIAIKNDKAQLQDKINTLFSGTTVTRGKARGIVIGTGVFTEKGKIREKLAEGGNQEVPLKKKLDEFGNTLSKAIGVICVIVWAINIGHFSDPAFGGVLRGAVYYFKISVSLAVAAIPEGLPAVVTTCLALGTQRMAAKNAIVTCLPAVETLGCTTVICSDKTGTLTTNQMSVKKFFVLGNKSNSAEVAEFDVEGNTYAPVKEGGQPFTLKSVGSYASFNTKAGQALEHPASLQSLQEAAKILGLCNDSSITIKNGVFDKVGQSTEAAMKVLVEKIGHPDPALHKKMTSLDAAARAMHCNKHWESQHEKLYTLEFDRDRKSMSVLVKNSSGKSSLLVKGAWDTVLARCTKVSLNGGAVLPMNDSIKAELTAKINEYCEGENHFRCLVLAKIDDTPLTAAKLKTASSPEFVKFEMDMTFVGVVGILDPPREEVKASIQQCKDAGIRVIVITGDNKGTATAICKAIGVFGPGEDPSGMAFTGAEFKEMSAERKFQVVKTARLFARVEPLDKQELVTLLHKHKQIVAMTGDGVNDAPALKEADIGVAMGSGTAVAKGAAKMVLADDNFTTIVAAVEEGRNIYNNTKQFIRYLICSNIGEVVAIFVTAVTGLPEVLLPVQLLWVNLVTDGLPAVALGFNKPEPGIMEQAPRPHDEPIVSSYTFFRYMITGLYIGLATVAGSLWWYLYYAHGPHLTLSQMFMWARCTPELGFDCEIFEDKSPGTMSLSVLVTIEMFCALNSLSEKQSLLSTTSHPFSNLKLVGAMIVSFGLHFVVLYVPFMSHIFSVEPLNATEWEAVIMLALPVILIDEVLKFNLRRAAPKHHKQE